MKRWICLAQWFDKIITYFNPKKILLVEDENSQLGLFLDHLIELSHAQVRLIKHSWNQELMQENYEISILAFPKTEELTKQLHHTISEHLKHVTQVLYLVTSIQNEDLNYRVIHPLSFTTYEMSMRQSETQLNLQIYAFWPRLFPLLTESQPIEIGNKLTQIHKLNIVYYLPHVQLTGGIKCLLEQIRQLTKRGHYVSIIRRVMPNEPPYLPTWFDLIEGRDVQKTYGLEEHEDVRQMIPEYTDIVVVGWFSQLHEFAQYKGKVCLWEQGSEWLFGDFGEEAFYTRRLLYYMQYTYTLPLTVISVSKVVQDLLARRYGKQTPLLTCGIDTQFYYPEEKKRIPEVPCILIMGSPYLAFKQIHVALRVLDQLAKEQIPFKVKWISPVEVDPVEVDPIEVTYSRTILVSPPQDQLAQCYRTSDIFLFTSLYEAFAMPPLEAMASGIPVVATDCGGIMTYARPGENAIICRLGDEKGLLEGLKELLTYPERRSKMGKIGRQTALSLDYQIIGEQLESLLNQLCEK